MTTPALDADTLEYMRKCKEILDSFDADDPLRAPTKRSLDTMFQLYLFNKSIADIVASVRAPTPGPDPGPDPVDAMNKQ